MYICPKLNVFLLKYFSSGKYLYLYLSTFKVLLPGSDQHLYESTCTYLRVPAPSFGRCSVTSQYIFLNPIAKY